MINLKPYIYIQGQDAALDADFSEATAYGKVKPGKLAVFWKSGFRWHAMPISDIQRIFRRVELVSGKLCCGGRTYWIERLVLIRNDGSELVIHIGDDMQKKAEDLLQMLKDTHPRIQYGKV